MANEEKQKEQKIEKVSENKKPWNGEKQINKLVAG